MTRELVVSIERRKHRPYALARRYIRRKPFRLARFDDTEFVIGKEAAGRKLDVEQILVERIAEILAHVFVKLSPPRSRRIAMNSRVISISVVTVEVCAVGASPVWHALGVSKR